MSRLCCLALAFTLVAVHGNETSTAGENIQIRIIAGAEEVELGKAFPLTVVRTWSKELVPDDFSDGQLSPLVVRLKETVRREDDRHLEEKRLYECFAFSLEDVTIPAPSFKARPKDNGPALAVSGKEVTLRVKGLLNPESPGAVELPGELLPERSPFPWLPWTGGGAAALSALALLLWHLRRRARRLEALSAAPVVAPHARALERLRRLRVRQPKSAPEVDSYYVEASALMREYVGERFAVPVRERTTEEFLAAPQTAQLLEHSHRVMLEEFLTRCDLVKFGRHAPTAPDRESLLEAAVKFVEETRTGDTLEPAAAGKGET